MFTNACRQQYAEAASRWQTIQQQNDLTIGKLQEQTAQLMEFMNSSRTATVCIVSESLWVALTDLHTGVRTAEQGPGRRSSYCCAAPSNSRSSRTGQSEAGGTGQGSGSSTRTGSAAHGEGGCGREASRSSGEPASIRVSPSSTGEG